ncbi:MAG: hypothetical protein DMG95_12180 [Acidobacteria bacterium]|nr:MAG: hypothetical protein DMG95_12180 [Acidobacteriota bacterium]
MSKFRVRSEAEPSSLLQGRQSFAVVLQLIFAKSEHRESRARLLLLGSHEMCKSVTGLQKASRIE